jgi:hypothetical protein
MGGDSDPVRWLRDTSPAAWATSLLDESFDQVSALVPGGYEAYARLVHPPQSGPRVGTLPIAERRFLIDILRAETTTPARCWFCVAETRGLDDQGVAERVRLPSGGPRYLLHAGPIEMALASPPEKTVRLVIKKDATLAEIGEDLKAQAGPQYGFLFPKDATAAELAEALNGASWSVLAEQSPGLWWPDDRAWFVATGGDLTSSYVGGSRRLVDRLKAEPKLQAFVANLTDSLFEARDTIDVEIDRRPR